jgi:hypothetical protein
MRVVLGSWGSVGERGREEKGSREEGIEGRGRGRGSERKREAWERVPCGMVGADGPEGPDGGWWA